VIKVLQIALVGLFLSFSTAGWAASIQSIYDMGAFLAEPNPFDRGPVAPPRQFTPPTFGPGPLTTPPAGRIYGAPAASPAPAAGTPIPKHTIQQLAPAKKDGGVWHFEFVNEDRGFLEDPFDAVFDIFHDDEDKTGHLTWAWRVSYAPNRNPAWFKNAKGYLHWLVGGKNARIAYSLQQGAYVPNSINADNNFADRPYAGLLLANFRAIFADEFKNSYQGVGHLNLGLGFVGPASGAEVIHRSAHSLIGRSSRGWDEIKSEPVVILQYEKGARFVFGDDGFFNFEAFPHIGTTLGNAFTYGVVGTTFRVGSHLRKDSGAPRMRMITTGTNFPAPGSYFVWSLFTGIEWRAVGYNITVDGNTYSDTSDVDSKPLVQDFQLGGELGWGAYRLSVIGVRRSKEFNGQEEADVFLRATFSAPL
jgi:hypothetical protein